MRQIARRLRDGRLTLIDVPAPTVGRGQLSVQVESSLISAGTERATLEVARKSLPAKVRARPEQARQVIERTRREGLTSTLALVRQRLDELSPLGYSAAGTVLEASPEVEGIAPGDKVAIGGGGYANHAEIDVVLQRLCVPVPATVSLEQAAFTTVGAIAMHGFRRAEAEVGSTVAIIGLGLIGQLATRIALAAGCRVIGVDLDARLCALAERAGALATPRESLGDRYDGTLDAVLICASAPGSQDPVRLAASLTRDRAPVVIVGDVGLDLPREPFYMGEIDLRFSRSYGPGRYDPRYEEGGHDYPIGYVRWTEQRNMTAFLQLVADGKLDPCELLTHRVPFAHAERAFELLAGEASDEIAARYAVEPAGPTAGKNAEPLARPLGIVLDYEPPNASKQAIPARLDEPAARRWTGPARRSRPRFGLIGAGSFATATIVPGLLGAGLSPAAVASSGGLSAEDARGRFGFEAAYADGRELLEHPDLDLIVIATRHDSHARLATEALGAGLPTYVEKPLSLDAEGLVAVAAARRASQAPLWVGFNRRYAPLAVELRNRLESPRLMHYRVNAGRLPATHWTNDIEAGGGRLLGEACHFVDFLCSQLEAEPRRALASGFPSGPGLALLATDNFNLRIEFADGSVGTIDYAADAPAGPGKERIEATAPGVHAVLDDFRSATVWTGGKRIDLGGRRQRKGWEEQYAAIAAVLRGEAEPPAVDAFELSSLTTLAAARSLLSGAPEPIVVDDPSDPSD